MVWLLKNWKLVASASGGVILTAALAWFLHDLSVSAIERDHLAALDTLKTTLERQCHDEKALTTEVSNGLQKKIASLNSELARLKRVRERAVCVPVPTEPSPGHDAAASAGEPPRPHGVMDTALLDFAAEAERYRLQLIACQEFVKKTWELKGE